MASIIRRGARLCGQIGREVGANMQVLMPAALFHNTARALEESQGIDNALEGARIAEAYLRSNGYDEARIPQVTHAIRSRRVRSREEPVSLEAKILSDADKLDTMGAVGLARTFMHASEQNGEIGMPWTISMRNGSNSGIYVHGRCPEDR